jgi:hypothetical protein
VRAYRLFVLEFLSHFPQATAWTESAAAATFISASQPLAEDAGVVFGELFQSEQLEEADPEPVKEESTGATAKKSERLSQPVNSSSEPLAFAPIQTVAAPVPPDLNVPIWDFKMEQLMSKWPADGPCPEGEVPERDTPPAEAMGSAGEEEQTRQIAGYREKVPGEELSAKVREKALDAVEAVQAPEPQNMIRQDWIPLMSPPAALAVDSSNEPPCEPVKKMAAEGVRTLIEGFDIPEPTIPKRQVAAEENLEAEPVPADTAAYKAQTWTIRRSTSKTPPATGPSQNQSISMLLNQPAASEYRPEAPDNAGEGPFDFIAPVEPEKRTVAGKDVGQGPRRQLNAEGLLAEAALPQAEPGAKFAQRIYRDSTATAGSEQTAKFERMTTVTPAATLSARSQTVFGLLLNRPNVTESREDPLENPDVSLPPLETDGPSPDPARRIVSEFARHTNHETERPDRSKELLEMTESIVQGPAPISVALRSSVEEQPSRTGGVWSRLDSIDLEGPTSQAEIAQPLSNINLSAPGHDRVSLRVVESPAGLEVRVSTDDREAKQELLSGLADLASRVRELSLGSVIEGSEKSDGSQEFSGGRRHQPPPDWEDRRPTARRTGVTFALPPTTGTAALN